MRDGATLRTADATHETTNDVSVTILSLIQGKGYATELSEGTTDPVCVSSHCHARAIWAICARPVPRESGRL